MAKQPAKKKPRAKAATKPAPAKRAAAKRAPAKRAAKAATDKPRGIVASIVNARRGLRQSFEDQMSAGYGEERLLAYVAFACLLAFVASLPAAMREEIFYADGKFLPEMVVGRFVAMVIFGPLFLYGVAAFSHIVSVWIFGGSGDYVRARIAFFWSLMLGIPLILIQAIVLQALDLTQNSQFTSFITWPLFLIWLWVWSTGIAVAESFSRLATFLFILVLGVVIFGLALVLSS